MPDGVDSLDTTDDGRTIFKTGTQWFLARREDEIDKRPAFRAILEGEGVRGAVKGLLGPGCYRSRGAAPPLPRPGLSQPHYPERPQSWGASDSCLEPRPASHTSIEWFFFPPARANGVRKVPKPLPERVVPSLDSPTGHIKPSVTCD